MSTCESSHNFVEYSSTILNIQKVGFFHMLCFKCQIQEITLTLSLAL